MTEQLAWEYLENFHIFELRNQTFFYDISIKLFLNKVWVIWANRKLCTIRIIHMVMVIFLLDIFKLIFSGSKFTQDWSRRYRFNNTITILWGEMTDSIQCLMSETWNCYTYSSSIQQIILIWCAWVLTAKLITLICTHCEK